MSVMNCPFCGKELPQESNFCPYCMEQISVPINASVPQKRNNKQVVIVAFILLVLMFVFGGIFLLHKGNQDDDSNNKTLNTPTEDAVVNDEINFSDKQGNQEPEITENEKIDTDPCLKGHEWIELTEIIHYDEVGHYETVEKQRQVTKYKCPICYEDFTDIDEYYKHFDNAHKPSYDGDPVSIMKEKYTIEKEYETYETKDWVVDKEAHEDIVVTGYKCKICGKEKNN